MKSIRPLIIIILAELFGTSLWFSGNNAIPELRQLWELSDTGASGLLMAVQAGFILGTLLLAFSGLADAIPAHRLFAISSLLGAGMNAGFLFLADDLPTALVFRFLTGVTLAGVYPLGMKLVVSWMPQSAGNALGWLVGALTLGTATPFLARAIGGADWRAAILSSSILALIGAGMIAGLGEGPTLRAASRFDWGGVLRVFRIPAFRASALGYFGHMWELYAFWAMVPLLVQATIRDHSVTLVSAGTFAVIATGAAGCVIGGLITRKIGSMPVARISLAGSGVMCAAAPILPELPGWFGFSLLIVWGFLVVADSPQFSAMSAAACRGESVGSALSVQNAIGFSITVAAILVTAELRESLQLRVFWILLPGPILGSIALFRGPRK
jgi:Major Facilitator Superfamily